MLRTVLASLALIGCTAGEQPRQAAVTGPAAPVAAPSLAPAPPLGGSAFRIVSVDGREPEMIEEDSGQPRVPRFAFARRSYGGTSGCNGMGGLYAEIGDRLYTMPGPQTQMGCPGRLGEQEQAIDALFAASPVIVRLGDSLELRGGGHAMRLAHDPAAPVGEDAPVAWQGEAVAGQSFIVWAVNGAPAGSTARNGWPAARLRFTADRLSAMLDCPRPLTARYRQDGDRLRASDVAPACAAPRDRALAALLAASPRLVSGPNGELLLAGSSGWATAENERRDRPK